jgi:hypothetical protein
MNQFRMALEGDDLYLMPNDPHDGAALVVRLDTKRRAWVLLRELIGVEIPAPPPRKQQEIDGVTCTKRELLELVSIPVTEHHWQMSCPITARRSFEDY